MTSTTPAAGTGTSQGTRFMVQWEEHPMHLATRLGYLLEHQSLVDVTLMCNTHTLKVHRSVLAACSPYFESVLQRQLGNHPLIVLKDMKFCVLKSLIEFMYCGETSVTEENLNPLMEAAKFFEVKGLCTMSKEVLGGERPSPNKPVTATTLNGTSNSIADIIPSSSYRGRGRRGVGRGRRNLTPMLGAPNAETAQIMLSLSGHSTTPTLQTTSRNVRISPNSRLGNITGSTVLDSSNLLRNGALTTPDLKTLREQLNLEPRRRGRRRTNFGIGRGRIRDLVDTKFGIQTIKKEADDIQQKDGLLFKTVDSKMNPLNNNGNNDAKSPLLASLLSKAEALAKAKVKKENDPEDNSEQETVMYQFDGESSGASKYLEALKEAGLPTDVPVLIDNGDGNYVTLTEDVLMNVLGNNEEFQFQVTEATLEQGDVSEGVVLQDGTIMMTGKNGKSDVSGPLLTVGKKSFPIKGVREVKGKRGPKPKQLFPKDIQQKLPDSVVSPQKTVVKKDLPGKKSVQELINDAVLESLKNGAANEAESDPDAVVLFEVTDNDKVCKYVVSSKEISALKALNEQLGKQKKENSPGEKKSPLPTMIDGNTNIAEIKLTIPKNSRKSIVSEVLARAHSLENQVKTEALNEFLQKNEENVKNEVDSPQMLDLNMHTDVLNDSSQLMNINPGKNNLETPSMMDLGDDSHNLDDENSMVVLNEQNQIVQLNEHTGQMGENQIIHLDGHPEEMETNQILQLNEHPVEMDENEIIQFNEHSRGMEENEIIQLNEHSMGMEENEIIQLNGRPVEIEGNQIIHLEKGPGEVEETKIIQLNELQGVSENEIIQPDENELKHLNENQEIDANQIVQLDESEEMNMADTDDLMFVKESGQILQQEGVVGLVEEQNDDPQLLQINENSQTMSEVGETTQETEGAIEDPTRDMPSLESESQLVQLKLIDGNGEKIEGVFIQKQLSELTGLSEQGKNADVIELLDMVCEGAASQENTQVLTTVSQDVSPDSAVVNVTPVENTVSQTQYSQDEVTEVYKSSSEHLVMEEVQIVDSRHLQPGEMSLDEQDCQELSVEQALEAMMGDENSVEVEDEEFREEEPTVNPQECTTLQQLTQESESANVNEDPNNFELVYAGNESFSTEVDGSNQNTEVKTNLSEESTNVAIVKLQTQIKIEEEPPETNDLLPKDVTFKEEPREVSEASVISPTKDVPFAVGLLPLKDALAQIQSIPEYQPRKTRSGSTSKVDTVLVGSKRRISVETSVEGSVKRKKSFEGEAVLTNQIGEENCLNANT